MSRVYLALWWGITREIIKLHVTIPLQCNILCLYEKQDLDASNSQNAKLIPTYNEWIYMTQILIWIYGYALQMYLLKQIGCTADIFAGVKTQVQFH